MKGLILLLLLCSWTQCSVFNAPCQKTAECVQLYNRHYECYQNHCQRVAFEFKRKEILGFVLVTVVSVITNSGGVGAGTIIIPVFIYFFGFVSSDAIPLSRITIFAGSIVNYMINWNLRDPRRKNHFMIDYNLACVMMPLLLAGTQTGVILARFLPSFVVTCILVVYLLSSTGKMWDRAIKETQKERENSEKLKALESGKEAETIIETKESKGSSMETDDIKSDNSVGSGKTILRRNSRKNPEELQSNTADEFDVDEEDNLIVDRKQEQEVDEHLSDCQMISRQWFNMILILFSFFVVVMSSLARGGEGRPSIFGLESCKQSSWLVFFLTQLVAILLAYLSYQMNIKDFDQQDGKLKDPKEKDTRRQLRQTLIFASYSTGIIAGLLGVGGGMILGLYMLSLGMDAQESTALSTYIVLFSSCATTFQFLIVGAIHMRHAVLFMAFSLLGSLIGNLILKALIKKYNKPSLLIWTLFSVLIIATAVLPIEMIIHIMKGVKSALTFGPLC